ncbi:MAG: pyridoxal-dependent decarboxylase [Balneolaceae bacterium]
MTDKKRIRSLEKSSRVLEPNREEREGLHIAAENWLEAFLNELPSKPAWREPDGSVGYILKIPIPEKGRDLRSILSEVDNHITPWGLNTASGGDLGYIPGGGLVASAYGDLLAAVINPYAGVYASSPGAVNLEARLVQWMAGLIGFEGRSGGYLASGGSLANLAAVVAAREHAGLSSGQFSKAVIYLTSQTHHCVTKALKVSGMSDALCRWIPVDARFRMDTEKLNRQVMEDGANGLIPWMVVGSGGTTDSGAVDPLEAIADVAESNRLWFHVDAAYGGFFLLTAQGRERLAGIERSDSVVMDPHKGLFLPYGLGALVVRQEKHLLNTFQSKASYLQDTESENPVHSPSDLSPELSKHFRSLRLWLPLQLHGVQPFRDALEEKLLLAQYAHQEIGRIDRMEVGPEPDLSVFTFRYLPESGETETFNRALHHFLLEDGSIFISSTRLNGAYMLRAAILSFRTHLNEVDHFLDLIRRGVRELESNQREDASSST